MEALIIDDDSTSNLILENILKKTAVFSTINTFNKTDDALVFFRKKIKANISLPDVIFLDIYMPEKNGWYFLEEYQKLRATFQKDIKIVLLTSSIDKKDKQYAKKFDYISAFVVKPLEVKDLQKIFTKIL